MSGIFNTIMKFLTNGVVWVLRGGVILAGVAAVFALLLVILKPIIGKLNSLVNGGSGGGRAGQGPVSKLLGTVVNTIDRGINGALDGVGTVFNGVANTTGMVRDKVLGNNRNGRYDNRNGRNNKRGRRGYNDYNDYYGYNDGYNDNRRRNNRRGMAAGVAGGTAVGMAVGSAARRRDEDRPIAVDKYGRPITGDPNDPTDPYYRQQRMYDENGFDQFGFNDKGMYKDEVKQHRIKQNKMVNDWVKASVEGKEPNWYLGTSGLTYASVYAMADALNLDVPIEWRELTHKDTGIKTTLVDQHMVNGVGPARYAPQGGVTIAELENNNPDEVRRNLDLQYQQMLEKALAKKEEEELKAREEEWEQAQSYTNDQETQSSDNNYNTSNPVITEINLEDEEESTKENASSTVVWESEDEGEEKEFFGKPIDIPVKEKEYAYANQETKANKAEKKFAWEEQPVKEENYDEQPVNQDYQQPTQQNETKQEQKYEEQSNYDKQQEPKEDEEVPLDETNGKSEENTLDMTEEEVNKLIIDMGLNLEDADSFDFSDDEIEKMTNM